MNISLRMGKCMAITRDTLTLLWATSFGICAYPGCNQELVCTTTQDIIGHKCHIVARKPDGPRGDSSYPIDRLDDFDNLILLCPTHHTIVDKDVETYTSETLKDMKAIHYETTKQRLQTGQPWSINISQFYYLNIPRLASLPCKGDQLINMDCIQPNQCLHDLGTELNSIMMSFKDVLHILDIASTPLSSPWHTYRPGQIISFNEKFRTKNVPRLNEYKVSRYDLRGDLKHDPHLYLKRGESKFTLTLDPRWLTTTTSFVNFRMWWINVAGLAIVKSVATKQILATPYVIGTPRNELMELLFSGQPLPRTVNLDHN